MATLHISSTADKMMAAAVQARIDAGLMVAATPNNTVSNSGIFTAPTIGLNTFDPDTRTPAEAPSAIDNDLPSDIRFVIDWYLSHPELIERAVFEAKRYRPSPLAYHFDALTDAMYFGAAATELRTEPPQREIADVLEERSLILAGHRFGMSAIQDLEEAVKFAVEHRDNREAQILPHNYWLEWQGHNVFLRRLNMPASLWVGYSADMKVWAYTAKTNMIENFWTETHFMPRPPEPNHPRVDFSALRPAELEAAAKAKQGQPERDALGREKGIAAQLPSDPNLKDMVLSDGRIVRVPRAAEQAAAA